MKKLSQSGFSLVEGLLLLVIVGIIGGAGYYVWDSQMRATDSLENSANLQSVSQNTNETNSTKEYISEEYGFKFSYPSEADKTGPIEIRKSASIPKTGEAYDICIGFCDKVKVGFVTRDWSTDDDYKAAGFTKYNNCEETQFTPTKTVKLYEDESTCLVLNATTSDYGGKERKVAFLLAQKQFSEKSKYAGIEIRNSGISIDSYSDESIKSGYKDSHGYATDLLTLIKSFQEL